MDIVFCIDRSVIPGLHVAAYSLLDNIDPTGGTTRFSVFSDTLDESDKTLLARTLMAVGKPFELNLCRLDTSVLDKFPKLRGSLAAYYRLLAAQRMEANRFLYVDADVVCDLDVYPLNLMEMKGAPAGWVPEAPLSDAVDRALAAQLGNSKVEHYFNSGVMLVNVPEWQRQRVTEKALDYIAKHQPAYHDQSALNYVLYQNALTLDEKYNCLTNQRKNWPALRSPYGRIERLVHFLDSPKPWNFFGEWLHPQYQIWRAVLDRTAIKNARSWQDTPGRKFPMSGKAWLGYKKAAKDRLLFAGYARGWLKQVKGVKSNI